tara:strand:+ start:369392 stop:369787 length:396 start_codon:yes stop_codon:yes gene_type:complete
MIATIFMVVTLSLLGLSGAITLGYHFGHARGVAAGLEQSSTTRVTEVSSQLAQVTVAVLESNRQQQRLEVARDNGVLSMVSNEPKIEIPRQPQQTNEHQPIHIQSAIDPRSAFRRQGALVDTGASFPSTSM